VVSGNLPYTFSPSSLSLLRDCPRCFWLYFNKHIKRPTGAFPSLPSGMDRILKAHFDSFMERGLLPPELQSLEGEVTLFDDIELLKAWRNNLKGIQWKDKEGNLFRGAIDNLLVKEEKLIVLDYKTRGYPVKDDTAEHYQDQLNIYNLLLRKNGYKTEEYAYLLFFHPDKVNERGEVLFHRDLIKMPVSIKSAEDLFKKALNTLESRIPKASEECDYCNWVSSLQ